MVRWGGCGGKLGVRRGGGVGVGEMREMMGGWRNIGGEKWGKIRRRNGKRKKVGG